MPRPGSDVILRNTPSIISLPTDTGTAFMTGTSDMGPLAPKLLTNINDFVNVFGARQTYSPLYDSVEVFFREGGNLCYVSRVVGPNPTYGFKNLLDAGAGISLVATAIGPGAWSANYKVAVVAPTAGGVFKIQVTDINNVVLEDSGDLVTQADAVNWSAQSNYIRITLGATALVPALLAATVLSAGTDDRVNAVDAQWANALALFTIDLGPGQVLAPGRTTDVGHTQLVAHAEANRRVALLDAPNTATSGTITASAGAARSRMAAMFGPWVIVPGVVSVTFRTIPPSPVVAGIIARNDPSLGANHPGAGRFGVSNYAYDLSQPDWDDATRSVISLGGANAIRRLRGVIDVYGWRSTVAAATDSDWIGFGNGRLYMAIAAKLDVVAENYVFDEIDGQSGDTINGFHSALAGVMMDYFNTNQLFGATPDVAFTVDTGPGVNTLATIAANELHAVVSVKMAPMAEYVKVEIVKRAVNS